MLTFDAIRADLTKRLSFEEVVDLIDSTTRDNAINDAYLYVTALLRLKTSQASGSVVLSNTDVCAIPAPSDMLQLHSDGVFWRSATNKLKRLVSIDIHNLISYDPAYLLGSSGGAICGEPTHYYYDPRDETQVNSMGSGGFPTGAIIVTPRPENGILNYLIRYSRKPTPMSTGTDQPWDGRYEQFNECLAARAAAQILGGARGSAGFAQSNFFQEEFERCVARFNDFLARQNQSTTRIKFGAGR